MKLLLAFLTLMIAVTVVCDVNLRHTQDIDHPIGGDN